MSEKTAKQDRKINGKIAVATIRIRFYEDGTMDVSGPSDTLMFAMALNKALSVVLNKELKAQEDSERRIMPVKPHVCVPGMQ